MTRSSVVDRLEPGDHVCWTFDADDERDVVLADYVRAALPAHHKVIYFSHTQTPPRVVAALARAGIDVTELTSAGQLEVHDARDAYLVSGRFDPEAMIDGCEKACSRAKAEGYAALRLAGEMAWATEPFEGAERLAWYESQVNRVYAGGYGIGLCLYDERRFPPSLLRPVRAQHPASVTSETDEAWTPLLRIRRLPRAGLRLDGATDLSNRGALQAMLDSIPGPGPGRHDGTLIEGDDAGQVPVLDVTGVDFMDVAGARAIIRSAARLGGLVLVGASTQLLQLLELLGAFRTPELVVQVNTGVVSR